MAKLFNHCGIPLAENDERKPSFVRYEDYLAVVEKMEECNRRAAEVMARLIDEAIY